MRAYYNEIEPYAAQWLRNLVAEGLITPGDVDTRSIEDVKPSDLTGYTRCHFFAGIGIWDHALNLAGWRERQVWTGSCPCQPFSTAGQAGGFADERHLWPAFHHLISQCQPDTVFGEQVASKDGLTWLDLVHTDMEAAGYAFTALDLCAAGVGAPHIRQRLYFVGARAVSDTTGVRLNERGQASGTSPEERLQSRSQQPWIVQGRVKRLGGDGSGVVGHTIGAGLEGYAGYVVDGHQPGWLLTSANGSASEASCTNGFWEDAEWLPFRDSKVRPVEPRTFPLVNGHPSIVGKLCAYGNAIVAPLAATFIRSFMECRP